MTLQMGSSGSAVKKLQQLLTKQGYTLSEDGIFGNATDVALRDYQKKNGLTVDGIAGEQTLNSLWGISSPSSGNAKLPSSAITGAALGAQIGASVVANNNKNNNTNNNNSAFTYDDFTYDDYKGNGKEFEYGDFKGKDYAESDIVSQAKAALNAQLSQKPGEYSSQWQAQLDDTINKILNREEFSYDLNGDALYQQYKDKFIQQGKMAMGDAIGQASAMTGGYGNSYAQSVGQQMYQKELQNLNDIVPELYQMALDKYSREGQELKDQYGMLADRENMDYGRYRDSVADFLTERDYLTGRYESERDFDYGKYVDDRNFDYSKYADDRNFEYGKYVDDRNFDYGKYIDDKNFAYGKYADDKSYAYNEYRNAIEDAIRREEFEYQQGRDKVADEQWQKAFDYQKEQDSADRTESNAKTHYETGGKVGYNNGSVSPENIKRMQEALGISADGKWGSGSTAAAGGMSADEAWKAYQNGTLGKANPGQTVQPAETKNTTQFINRFQTKSEYLSRGHSEKEFNQYMENNIASFLRDDRITEEEALYLIQYYGIK